MKDKRLFNNEWVKIPLLGSKWYGQVIKQEDGDVLIYIPHSPNIQYIFDINEVQKLNA